MADDEFLKSYLARVQATLLRLDVTALMRFADMIDDTVGAAGQVFFLGNGGSAATATHYVNDLVMAYARTGRVVRAASLSDNAALVTGIANDYSFEDVFSFQLQALALPGDAAVAISASGNSPNLIKGLRFAKDHGLRTAAIVGFDGGALRSLADVVVHGPTDLGDYGPAEDIHLIINHAVAGLLRDRGAPV